MQSSLENLAPGYGSIIMWSLIIIAGLLVLWLVVRILRKLSLGTFIAGGKNRKMRLAIMDATPVDNNRQLVLIRRDDVEHLILIGGPNDVVVEQNIRPYSHQARPAREAEAHHRPEPVVVRPSPSQPRAIEPAPVVSSRHTEAPRPAPVSAQPRPEPSVSSAPSPAPEVRIDTPARPAASAPATQKTEPVLSTSTGQDKIDEEMEKFLGDLTQLNEEKRD